MRRKVVALILEKQGLYLIEKRKTSARTNPDKFVFPGGHVDKNESLTHAITREAFEELNIKLANPTLIYQIDFDGPEEKQRLYWYWCDKFTGIMENNEAAELVWIKPTELHKLSYQVSRDAFYALLTKKNQERDNPIIDR